MAIRGRTGATAGMSRTSRDQTNHNFIEDFSFILLTVLNREEGGEETHMSKSLLTFFWGGGSIIPTLAATKEASLTKIYLQSQFFVPAGWLIFDRSPNDAVAEPRFAGLAWKHI